MNENKKTVPENGFSTLSTINGVFTNLLKKYDYLRFFIEYLEKNKIEFKILRKKEDDYLLLELLTLEPLYLLIIINEEAIKKYEVAFDSLNLLETEFLKQNKIFFIIYLAPSINSIDNVISKSKYVNVRDIKVNRESKRLFESYNNISLKKYLQEGLPLGIFSQKNKMNDLTGREWIKFTKSWFIHNPPPRRKIEILHPAKFPETLIEAFIKFFTKKGQIVLDPFLGSGSTAVASKNLSRSCIGFEISKKYADITKSRISHQKLDKWLGIENENLMFKVFQENSNNLEFIWQKFDLPLADFCITSPPYWNQLKRNNLRQKERKESGLDTIYSDDPKDIGNIDDYKQFIKAQKNIFDRVYNVLKNRAYLVIITNNVYFDGRLYPLAYDTAISLTDKWVLKDEKIWLQDDKTLLPLGINNAWIGNRCHQFCLVFRKEENS